MIKDSNIDSIIKHHCKDFCKTVEEITEKKIKEYKSAHYFISKKKIQ